MLTVEIGGKKVGLWSTLAKMVIAGVASYGIAKADDPETSWTKYRDGMISSMAQVALPFAVQNIPGIAEQAEQSQNVNLNN